MSSVEQTKRIRFIFLNVVNPFHFGQVKKVCENQTIVILKTENYARDYADKMKALKFDDDSPNVPYKEFEYHFFWILLQRLNAIS